MEGELHCKVVLPEKKRLKAGWGGGGSPLGISETSPVNHGKFPRAGCRREPNAQ